MPTLLYLHGFLSSPQSVKAVQAQRWLAQHHPSWRFECPQLPVYPQATMALLDKIAAQADAPLNIIGSSLGGFWATYLAEQYSAKAVLVNPSVSPQRFAATLVGETLKNYHTEDTYVLTTECVATLRRLEQPLVCHPSRYWLLAQTGDTTLDYREAVVKYQGCKHTIEEGGSHSFDGFDSHLPAIFDFFKV